MNFCIVLHIRRCYVDSRSQIVHMTTPLVGSVRFFFAMDTLLLFVYPVFFLGRIFNGGSGSILSVYIPAADC